MTRGTIITVLIALGSVIGAITMRPQELAPVQFEETGTELFPKFQDPTLAASLEVVEWDDEAAKVKQFKVEQKAGRWVIPSHNDYPADATERMGKAAASFIGVKRDVYYGDDASQHGAFGVLDPSDAAGKPDEKGQHIVLKDAAGGELVDLIVGNEVPEKEGYRYVRVTSDKRVYGSKITIDISTKFADWIEADLLRVEKDDVITMIYDPYQVDEAQGKVVGNDPLRFDLRTEAGAEGDSKQTWVLAPELRPPAGQVVDDAKVRTMVSSIDRLRIVGVRPRPERLTLPALQSKGFFVTPDGRRLYGNEGEVRIACKDGVVYTLYFGEVTMDSGLALTAGKDPQQAAAPGEADNAENGEKDPAAPQEQGSADAKDENAASRYLFVDVGFDPKLAAEQAGGQPDAGDADQKDPEKTEDPAAADVEQPAAAPNIEAGEKRAKQLQARFDAWFFVISDASFKEIHKPREELFKAAGEGSGAAKGQSKPRKDPAAAGLSPGK